MERFDILALVGEGSFGRVYKAQEIRSNTIIALKIILKGARSEKELRSLRQEYEIQKCLQHPNIIQLIESFETEHEYVLVSEFAQKDLHSVLSREGSIGEVRSQKLCHDLVSALYYLHSHRILHRDLKPQNILLDSTEKAKLCDFGLARNMTLGTHVLTSIKGTPLYMAPELLAEKPYDHLADIWSLGCIIYESVAGQAPFCTTSILQLIRLIKKETIKWPTFVSEPCMTFLKGLLQKDPNQRMSWPQILSHPFVQGHIIILNENIPSSPFTKSLTDSQNLMKQKQTEGFLLSVPPFIPTNLDKNHAIPISIRNSTEFTSSRDSTKALLYSDRGNGTDESSGDISTKYHKQEDQNTIHKLMDNLQLNKIVFVEGNNNLIVNRLYDNFPAKGQAMNSWNAAQIANPYYWNANQIGNQFNNFCVNEHNLQNYFNPQPAMVNCVTSSYDSMSSVSTFASIPKKKCKITKNSKLEKKKLNQNLEHFTMRLTGQQPESTTQHSKDSHLFKVPQSKEKLPINGSIPNLVLDDGYSVPLENDEWISFLKRVMKQITDGDFLAFVHHDLVSIILTPMRNPTASCQVIENAAQVLCLPLVVCKVPKLLTDIRKVYADVKAVPNLIYASKLLCSKTLRASTTGSSINFQMLPLSSLNGEELRTLSMLYELTCHMVHLNTHFVSQFCDAVAILGAYKLLVNFLCHVSDENNTTIRLVNNVLATLACALRELPENAEIIERIIFDKDVDLAKLFRHNDPLLKTRLLMLFRLLGRFSCFALQNNWTTAIRESLELLPKDEEENVRTEATALLEEFRKLSFYYLSSGRLPY